MFLVCALNVQGTTYYVSPAGNDANNGLTPGTAWQSLLNVYLNLLGPGSLLPGDSILMEGSQVHSSNGVMYFNAANAGNRTDQVYIGSYGTGKAIIDAGNNFGMFFDNAGGITIENLIITSSNAGGSSSSGIYFLTSSPTDQLEAITIKSVEVFNFIDGGFTMGTYGTGTRGGYKDVLIEDCEFYNNGEHGVKIYGEPDPTGYNHQNIVVRNSQVHDNPGNPSTTKINTGHGIVVSQAEDILIEGVIAFRNGSDIASTTKGPMSIWIYDVSDGIIQRCESYETQTDAAPDGTLMGGGGIGIDGGSKNCVIQYCYTHDNEGPGYLIDNYDAAKSTDGVTVRFNISEDDVRNGIYGAIYCHKDPSAALTNLNIYHNTIFTSATPGASSPAACLRFGVPGIEASAFGNILYSDGGPLVFAENSAASPLTIQYNLYFASGSTPIFSQNGVNYVGLASWQTATGHELVGGSSVALTTDPLLTDPGNGGTVGDPNQLVNLTAYQLTSSSTLSTDGINVKTALGVDPGPQDFFGLPITGTGLTGMGSALDVPIVFAIGEGIFEVTRKGAAASLSYDLDPEDRIDYIEVQTNSDLEPQFRSLGNMTASDADRYEHLDYPSRGIRHYYRLKVVQLDGRTSLTDVQSFILPTVEDIRIARITEGNYKIWLDAPENESVAYQIYTVNGQIAQSGELTMVSPGEWELNTQQLSTGSYWVRISSSQIRKSVALPTH